MKLKHIKCGQTFKFKDDAPGLNYLVINSDDNMLSFVNHKTGCLAEFNKDDEICSKWVEILNVTISLRLPF